MVRRPGRLQTENAPVRRRGIDLARGLVATAVVVAVAGCGDTPAPEVAREAIAEADDSSPADASRERGVAVPEVAEIAKTPAAAPSLARAGSCPRGMVHVAGGELMGRAGGPAVLRPRRGHGDGLHEVRERGALYASRGSSFIPSSFYFRHRGPSRAPRVHATRGWAILCESRGAKRARARLKLGERQELRARAGSPTRCAIRSSRRGAVPAMTRHRIDGTRRAARG